MSSDTPQTLPELEAEQLCISCLAPNKPSAHFCSKCGAPLSSYATIAPFEHLFAEGFIFRQATERPRNVITVLGVWLMFGTQALAIILFLIEFFRGGIVNGRGVDSVDIIMIILGAGVLVFSLMMIWKTTRSYLTAKKTELKQRELTGSAP
jgi:hypothetical protein